MPSATHAVLLAQVTVSNVEYGSPVTPGGMGARLAAQVPPDPVSISPASVLASS